MRDMNMVIAAMLIIIVLAPKMIVLLCVCVHYFDFLKIFIVLAQLFRIQFLSKFAHSLQYYIFCIYNRK